MPEEEIGRQDRVAIARAAYCLIARVFHQPVAFVHQDDRRKASAASRIGEKRGHSVLANDVLRSDVAHSLSFGAGRGAESGKSAKESEFCKEFTPWCQYHCCPPFHSSRGLEPRQRNTGRGGAHHSALRKLHAPPRTGFGVIGLWRCR